jgi:hypothetical protein
VNSMTCSKIKRPFKATKEFHHITLEAFINVWLP